MQSWLWQVGKFVHAGKQPESVGLVEWTCLHCLRCWAPSRGRLTFEHRTQRSIIEPIPHSGRLRRCSWWHGTVHRLMLWPHAFDGALSMQLNSVAVLCGQRLCAALHHAKVPLLALCARLPLSVMAWVECDALVEAIARAPDTDTAPPRKAVVPVFQGAGN